MSLNLSFYYISNYYIYIYYLTIDISIAKNKLKLLGYNFITLDLEGYISSKFDKLLN